MPSDKDVAVNEKGGGREGGKTGLLSEACFVWRERD